MHRIFKHPPPLLTKQETKLSFKISLRSTHVRMYTPKQNFNNHFSIMIIYSNLIPNSLYLQLIPSQYCSVSKVLIKFDPLKYAANTHIYEPHMSLK